MILESGTVQLTATEEKQIGAIENKENANFVMTGGEIISNLDGIINYGINDTEQNLAEISEENSEIKIEGGKIISNLNAIINNYNGTIEIGDNDELVNSTSPNIFGKVEGIKTSEAGTFNFYDGIIKGSNGKSIDGIINDKPDNYSVINGTEYIEGYTYETSFLQANTAKVSINTESMYVTEGLEVRLDGIHNDNQGQCLNTNIWKNLAEGKTDATITDGKWGANHLEFNGTSTYVNLGQVNNENQTLHVTFSTNELDNTDQYIIGNWENGGGGIYISSGYINGKFYIEDKYYNLNSNVKIEKNKIYDVALTYDGNSIILYVNGIEKESLPVSGTIKTPDNSTIMVLGGNPTGLEISNCSFNGKIYSVGVYNRALSQEEILKNSSAGLAMAGAPTDVSEIEYTIRFSENVTGFSIDGVEIENGNIKSFDIINDGTLYKVVSETTELQSGTQKIILKENCAIDASGYSIPKTEKSVFVDRIKYSEFNQEGNEINFYENLQTAMNQASNGSTIKVLKDTLEKTDVTLGSETEDKEITIDLNGKIILLNNSSIVNNENLTIKDSKTTSSGLTGKIISNTSTIKNNGTLNIAGGNIINTGSIGISSSGSFNMTGGTVTSKYSTAVYISEGSANISGGIIEKLVNSDGNSYNGACLQYNGSEEVNISGTAIIQNNKGSQSSVLYNQNTGSIVVDGAKVQNLESMQACTNTGAGKIIIKSGTVTSEGEEALCNTGVSGTIEVSGGNISTKGIALSNTGANAEIKITGGNILAEGECAINSTGKDSNIVIGEDNAISNEMPVITGKNALSISEGNVTIKAGRIEATEGTGVILTSGIVTIGNKDDLINIKTPSIKGTICGVQNVGGTLNFYDGNITGPKGNAINGTITDSLDYTKRISLNNDGVTENVCLGKNLMNGKELLAYDDNSSTYSYENNVYTVNKNGKYAGYYIPEGILENGKQYVLSYKIKRIEGTLSNITGYTSSTKQISFTIDGVESNIPYNMTEVESNIKDDSETHLIEFEFIYTENSDDSNNKIYIQPNREIEENLKVEISEVGLFEVEKSIDEVNIEVLEQLNPLQNAWNELNNSPYSTMNKTNQDLLESNNNNAKNNSDNKDCDEINVTEENKIEDKKSKDNIEENEKAEDKGAKDNTKELKKEDKEAKDNTKELKKEDKEAKDKLVENNKEENKAENKVTEEIIAEEKISKLKLLIRI